MDLSLAYSSAKNSGFFASLLYLQCSLRRSGRKRKTQLRSDMNIQYSISLHVAAEYSIEYYINCTH